MNRRQFILGSSLMSAFAAASAEKTTDGGLADVDWPARRVKSRPVLPPGAHGVKRFASLCVGCGLCAAVCPSKVLRPSTTLARLGRVELDFRHGWCRSDCSKCASVCPSGAIEQFSISSGVGKSVHSVRPHVGYAVWQRETCIRVTEGVACHACVKHCPVRAVKLIEGVPVVDRTACIGCGACEHYCPARPLTAIHVEGYDRHREYAPLGEDDLLDEMMRRIDTGSSAVVARNGEIVLLLEGRGLRPIEDAIAGDPQVFAGAVVADKVVGIKAAEVYVHGKARLVLGGVMSEGAKNMLETAGIEARFRTCVPQLECEKFNNEK